MIRAYKTEIDPTPEQIQKIEQSMGICRFLYNHFLWYNKDRHNRGEPFMSYFDFDKYVNNVLKKQEAYRWIDRCGSKARKKMLENANTAFMRFFNGQSKYPRYKKKGKDNVSLYFPKNGKADWTVERHRVKIPTLKWVRIKEKGYVPVDANVRSGTIRKQAGRYYVSILVEEPDPIVEVPDGEGIGLDLGIKEFLTTSNSIVYENINKRRQIRLLEKRMRRLQRQLSRKYLKNKKKGESTKNIRKQVLKVQKLHQRLTNIRRDYINKVIFRIIKQKPRFMVLEDLNVSGMMKNRHLSKAIAGLKLYEFREKLIRKTKCCGIEVRIVDRFYPSSKKCSTCGEIKKDLTLKDRMYHCEHCGNTIDRDLNASINLKNATKYKIA